MKTKTNLLLALMLISFAPMLHAQDFWEQLYFPDTVTIRCLTTNDSGYIFVGTGYNNEPGGLYRSVDNALSWELVLDAGSFTVQSIAVDEAGKIYIGKTGLDRFMVSKDNGDTWDVIDLPPPSYSNILKILCVGLDTIYVGSWEDAGAFITNTFDGGETWQHCFITDQYDEYVTDIAISGNDEIFVSVSGFSLGQGGVYKSVDWGITWEYVGLLNHQVETIEINPDNDVFTGDWWVLNDNPYFGIHALYQGADTSELVLDAFHANDIVIDPEGVIYAAANERVARSFDNGQNWELIDDALSFTIKYLNISYDGYLYGARYNRLVKSIDPLITALPLINQTGKDHLLKLYPNPSSKYLNILFEGKTNTGPIYVGLTNSEGKKVFEQKFASEEKLQIDIGHLPVGLYFARVRTNKELLCRKFIKR